MCKLLIVEDESITRKAMRECVDWESMGIIQVEEAANGQHALEMCKKLKPNIVITDIKMPKMDGLEFARQWVEMDQNTHFIITTAHKDSEYMRSAIKLKAIDYILKPVNVKELSDAVRSAVHSYKEKVGSQFLMEELGNAVHQNIIGIRDQFYNFILSGNVKLQSSDVESTKSKDSLMIASIKGIIVNHYDHEELSVKFIAEKLLYTSAYICMVFKKNTGITVNEFITLLRIQKAKELLADVTMKLYDVSTVVGFSDENYFSKVFKKIEGVTPTDYRRKGLSSAKD